MPSRGKFGLWYGRCTDGVPIRIVDDGESDESFRQRRDEAEEERMTNLRLNELNEKVREEIETRLWATMYLHYLTKRIYATAPVHITFTDLPNVSKLTLDDEALASTADNQDECPFKDLSLEIQLQILERRLEDARIGTKALWAEILADPSDSDLGFRVFDRDSKARLFPIGDIRCGNWQEFDVNQDLTRVEAKKHIEGARGSTDYISLTTSPRRLWNFGGTSGARDQKIAVIDLRVLRRLGIAYGSTTDDLCFLSNGPNRTKYATRHHILVVGWIPPRSVLGLLSKQNFKKLLKEGQIDTSGEAGDIPSNEHDKKIPFELISRRLEAIA